MFRVICIGLLLAGNSFAFDRENFLQKYCEFDISSSNLDCSYCNFSETDNDDIQNQHFILSNATFINFVDCDNVLANGAFFEMFPIASKFVFERCNIDISTETTRVIPIHEGLYYLEIRFSRLKDDYGMGTLGLKTLSQLREIIFDSTTFDSGIIRNQYFEQTPHINEITLENCGDSIYISPEAFLGSMELESLRITNNPNLIIEWYVFQGLEKLRYLTLQSNGLSQLDTQFLSSNLIYLDLEYNNIRFITESMFRKLFSLNILDLSNNAIEHISEEAFDNLENLQRLHLEKNNIKRFNKRHLNGVKSLMFIDISNNQVEDLDDDTFDDLKFLKYLNY